MNGHTLRITLRWLHIVCAVVMGAALYSPLKNSESFMTLVLYLIVPIVAVTGIAMWKQGKVMKWLNRQNGSAQRTT